MYVLIAMNFILTTPLQKPVFRNHCDTCDKVYILNKSYELIVEHPRLYGNGKESMKWLPYIELMAKRPTALKYTSFYDDLPENWRKYLNNQDYEGKRKGLLSLHKMLSTDDMRTASEALTFALSKGVRDTDSILAGYRTLNSNAQQMQPMQLKNALIDMPSLQTNNCKYDQLFQSETNSL